MRDFERVEAFCGRQIPFVISLYYAVLFLLSVLLLLCDWAVVGLFAPGIFGVSLASALPVCNVCFSLVRSLRPRNVYLRSIIRKRVRPNPGYAGYL